MPVEYIMAAKPCNKYNAQAFLVKIKKKKEKKKKKKKEKK